MAIGHFQSLLLLAGGMHMIYGKSKIALAIGLQRLVALPCTQPMVS